MKKISLNTFWMELNYHNGKMNIFTWHVHGSYLYYLSQGDYNLYIPIDESGAPGYGGRGSIFPFGSNVIEISREEVCRRSFDCILFQSKRNYLYDQFEIFSGRQLDTIPKIYLEHDPPREHPTDTVHIMQDPDVLLVHVTKFNQLMWNHADIASVVIEHGVIKPEVSYTGRLKKGAVVINNLHDRGRRLGLDIFLDAREKIPLDLIGMDSLRYGGLGEVPLPRLPEVLKEYRFLFNPIRYTSLGLAVCEAMMLGMPVVGLATTEMPSVIRNGICGFLELNVSSLIEKMSTLLRSQELASVLGEQARRTAEKKFDINRFTGEWFHTFEQVIRKKNLTKHNKKISAYE